MLWGHHEPRESRHSITKANEWDKFPTQPGQTSRRIGNPSDDTGTARVLCCVYESKSQKKGD